MRSDSIGSEVGGAGSPSWIRSLINRAKIGAKDRSDEREQRAAVAAGPGVAAKQAELISFYSHYEELVEVLCDAAQLGPTPALEKAYAREKIWMETYYPALRPLIVAYLRYSVEDAEQSLELQGKGADAFEALFAAPAVADFLSVDDGNMISRITRTREALDLYGEHLRGLAARQQA